MLVVQNVVQADGQRQQVVEVRRLLRLTRAPLRLNRVAQLQTQLVIVAAVVQEHVDKQAQQAQRLRDQRTVLAHLRDVVVLVAVYVGDADALEQSQQQRLHRLRLHQQHQRLVRHRQEEVETRQHQRLQRRVVEDGGGQQPRRSEQLSLQEEGVRYGSCDEGIATADQELVHEQHRGDLAGLPLPQALLQRVEQVLQQAGRLAVVAREGWRREGVVSVEAPTGLCGRGE